MAVLPFDLIALDKNLEWMQRGLPELITSDLSESGTVRIVDRTRQQHIERELLHQYSGRVADDALVNVGHQLGATILMTGTVTAVNQQDLRIDLRLTAVETGELLGSVSDTAPITDLLALEKHLTLDTLQLLDANPSPAQQAKWARPQAKMLLAIRSYHTGLTALQHEDYPHAKQAFLLALQSMPTYQPAQEQLWQPRIMTIPIDPAWGIATPDHPFAPLDPVIDDLLEHLTIQVTPLTTTTPQLSLTVDVSDPWWTRFSDTVRETLPGPFRALSAPRNEAKFYVPSPLADRLSLRLMPMTLTIEAQNVTNRTLSRESICLFHPSPDLGFPVIELEHQGAITMTRHRWARISVPMTLPPELRPHVHHFTTNLIAHSPVCRLAS